MCRWCAAASVVWCSAPAAPEPVDRSAPANQPPVSQWLVVVMAVVVVVEARVDEPNRTGMVRGVGWLSSSRTTRNR
uniref:Putative secreted protein n=1 Tax=Anopheles darlingi TaxID=43151 RepID=A0A2M4D720_ANODA